MPQAMSDIRRALVRKFGPLPAWAWAIIGGGALYLYRRNTALKAGTTTTPNTTTTDPSVTDQTGSGSPLDPTTLQPGDSVYDPNTGQLLGTSPPQTDPISQPDRPTPQVLEPGETIYDPATGQLFGGVAQGVSTAAPVTPAKKKAKKRSVHKPKKKHAHTQHTAVKRPTGGKSRSPARGIGKVMKNPLTRKHKQSAQKGRHMTPKAKGRPRGPVKYEPANTPRMNPRTAGIVSAPAMRQRPAAPHVVAPVTQRVAPHPAAPPPAHHEPVRRTPPPRKRR